METIEWAIIQTAIKAEKATVVVMIKASEEGRMPVTVSKEAN